MTNANALARARRAVLLAALLSLAVGTLPARAASAVDIEVRPLVGGRFEIGGWMALSVTLNNDGAPTDGYLTAETDGGVVRRFVEMPAGARKVVTLYVEPEPFQRELTVSYAETNGTVTATTEVRVLEQTGDQVAIVGDGTGALRTQLLGTQEGARPEPLALTAFEIPERPEPLGGLAAIVWAGDSSSLTEGQRRSLERWVADGGQLVVLGGPDWQARTAAFVEMLPVADLAAADGTPLSVVAAWAGLGGAQLEPSTVSAGRLRDDARPILVADDGTLIASMRAFGAGHVILVGADLATDEFRAWEGSPRLWSRLIPSNAALSSFFGGVPPREEMLSSMSGALGTLPTLQVPPAELLLVVIVGYILLIGPISYLILRRIDRRELAWVTAPILIVLFSACSYGIGRSLKGSDVVVNQIAVVRTSPNGAAQVETYAGIFSPDRSTYDLTVDADALLGSLPSNAFDGTGNPITTGNVVIEQGQPAHLRELAIGTFGFSGVQATGLAEVEPALAVTWATRDGEVVGTVTNMSAAAMSDVAYITGSGGERIGDLAPGASAEFTATSSGFNQSSASDQVYGFGGFGVESEEQRRVALRRGVIDALVGYGGGREGGLGVGRGPYVIGWRDDAGPMPILVDEVTSRRHATVVEVVSVRPAIGTGRVTVRPYQMGVTVTEVEGDVTAFSPGQVTINDGSVTFSIALPLEASGLAPTSVSVLVGPDATFTLDDAGDFTGFWPAGYTAEVRNPTTGEWTLLGDLSEGSRYDIDDPASALSPTGLIEVRIRGTAEPNFGQPGVFASARVEGVIDR
jgi:hypothetical protein